MQRPAKPRTPVRFRPQPPSIGPGGEIGRRKGLKIPRWQHRAGSSPALGTMSDFAVLHRHQLLTKSRILNCLQLLSSFSTARNLILFCLLQLLKYFKSGRKPLKTLKTLTVGRPRSHPIPSPCIRSLKHFDVF